MTYSLSFPIPQNMLDTIENCTVGLGGVGIIGGALGPGADLVIIAPTWAGMTIVLADQAGHSMSKQTAKKIAIAVATGVGSFAAGAKIAATVGGWLLALPTAGISLVLSCAGNAALNAKFTDAFGKAVASFFLQTDEIPTTDVVVQVLIALISVQFGLPSSHPDVTP